MSDNIHVRKFVWRDLERLTYLFNRINNANATEKERNTDFMSQFLSQPLLSPEENCYLAEVNGTPVGFVLLDPEIQIGRIVLTGGVLKSHRNQGIGRKLLNIAIRHAMEKKMSVMDIAIPEGDVISSHILADEGFKVVKKYSQMIWDNDEIKEYKLPSGFYLRHFQLRRDEQALTLLQNEIFRQSWGFCPNTVDQIKARIRFEPCDPKGIIFVMEGEEITAYNWTIRSSNNLGSTGTISMIGVHPNYRGLGLGKSIVTAGMKYLKNKGVKSIELEVDSENERAGTMYSDLGFRQTRQIDWYEKHFA